MWQARPLCICLICDFCSSDREFALGLLHTPPHDGRTCPLLTVPTAKPVVDFHHQVTVHSGQTTQCLQLPSRQLLCLRAISTKAEMAQRADSLLTAQTHRLRCGTRSIYF
nr:MAG TPA: hypothetical protein [Caudoviricetes sp.]